MRVYYIWFSLCLDLGASIMIYISMYLNNSILYDTRIPLTENNNPKLIYGFLNTLGHAEIRYCFN